MFRDIIDEKVKTVFKKRKVTIQKKIIKEKTMYIKLLKFNSIKSIYLKEIVAQIVFFFVQCMLLSV